jgi:hypothetical protein
LFTIGLQFGGGRTVGAGRKFYYTTFLKFCQVKNDRFTQTLHSQNDPDPTHLAALTDTPGGVDACLTRPAALTKIFL